MRRKWTKAGLVAMAVLILSGCGKGTASESKKTSSEEETKKEEIVTVEYEDSDTMGLNPILPMYEYVPDGEPHVYGDRVYVYGSHDAFRGNAFCVNDYVVYSADVNDLGNWRYEGVSYKKSQDPRYTEETSKQIFMYAPDVIQGPDGKYYLYYCLEPYPEIAVAVSDNPAGPFEYYGFVQHTDGTPLSQKEGDLKQFDPGAFVDDDGSVWLYSGHTSYRASKPSDYQASQVMELEQDMITLKTLPKKLLYGNGESEGTGFEGHEFFEASSMRKIGDTYYLIYSTTKMHQLCYATSKYPDRDFKYGGVIISNKDIFNEGDMAMNEGGNNHGSIVCVNDQWYIFYQRHTNGTQYSRQVCAERIYIEEDGSIPQVEITTTGFAAKSSKTKDWINAGRACYLVGDYLNPDAVTTDENEKHNPCVTQTGTDREDNPNSYVKSIKNYSLVGFKYFNCDGLKSITVSVCGDFKGTLEILDRTDGSPKGVIEIEAGKDWADITAEVTDMAGDSGIYFWAKGEGTLNFRQFKMNYEE